MAYIEMQHCYKRYTSGETEIFANRDVSFEIEKGELVIILGASGAGKSTVLNILGGMDTNDEGQVLIDGVDIAKLNSHQRTDYRRDDVGFVFQFYNLVPNLTAKENVELASEIVSDALDPEAVLKEVGLGNRLDNFPAQLSGESNNGWRLLGQWLKTLKFSFVMSQREPWITRRVSKYWGFYRICLEKRERRSSS